MEAKVIVKSYLLNMDTIVKLAITEAEGITLIYEHIIFPGSNPNLISAL